MMMVEDYFLGKALMGWMRDYCLVTANADRGGRFRLAGTERWFIIFRGWFSGSFGDLGVKCLIVYYVNGQWIGEEVNWKRSGSGSYREVARIEIPQTKAQIEAFAAEHRFVIEWRGKLPAETPSAASAWASR
jgi:hypothetical protein